jgi:hypothetical protein
VYFLAVTLDRNILIILLDHESPEVVIRMPNYLTNGRRLPVDIIDRALESVVTSHNTYFGDRISLGHQEPREVNAAHS